ncbi:hypothetical protein Esi_0251_0008 [Ectocarpus siliculosus]|uniref:Uncharacterized protein n=1 Tax=Ectocarpus siliculosus TaxID=2880 RepID=D7FTK0_ECTSI|nr:hypothetical protein Esi_0251_0008 [Ectocarpus siliculosus]|eukprot:CBJ31391.1 hypothetical protein Esi_0251_0008 [Ectocarpus siliculosus]
MVATGKDADNKLVHVATSICDKENTDNYSWFLQGDEEQRRHRRRYSTARRPPSSRTNTSRTNLPSPFTRRPTLCGGGAFVITSKHFPTSNSWTARAPTRTKFMDIMDAKVKPTKPKAYAALLDPKKPHELVKWTHHAGPSDTAIGSVVPSNAAEQNMAMVGLQGRKLPPMAQHILDKTASQMTEGAELCNSTSQRFTPYAATSSRLSAGIQQPAFPRHLERQLDCSQTRQQLRQPSGAGVRDRWRGDSHDSLDKSDEAMSSIDPAYHLDTYRALYADSRFEVQLPVPDELTVDVDILPPAWVPNQAGRPKKKGPSMMKRIPSRGEHASSTSDNVRLMPARPV